MLRKFISLTVIGLWGVFVLQLPEKANAATPLTKAEIQDLRNLVQLMRLNEPKRKAKHKDAMTPGDGLSTGRASLADLRFNDGSLARVGEQAVFRFLPQTRNFRLSNGTVLLVIPPGQGQTRINTPSAAAAIRGSALFVRYDQATDTTLVGALTNSGIQVYNQNASQSQELQAGQMIVVVKGKFKGLYDFDLRTFYDTSDLVRGLDLPLRGKPSPDPAIAQVQQETAAAVAAQKPIVGQGVVENPTFVKLTASTNSSTSNNNVRDNTPVNTLLETGQVFSNQEKQPLQIIETDQPLKPYIPSESVTKPPNPSPSVTPPTENSKPPSEPSIQPPTSSQIIEPIKPSTPNNQPPTNGNTTNPPTTPVTPVTPPTTPITPVTPPTTPVTPVTPPTTPVTPVTPPTNGNTTNPPTTPITPVTPPTTPVTPVIPPTNGNTTNPPTTPVTPVTPPTTPVTPVIPPTSTIPITPVTPPINTTPITPPTTPVTPVIPPTSTIPITPVTPPINTTPITPPNNGIPIIPVTPPTTPVTPVNPPTTSLPTNGNTTNPTPSVSPPSPPTTTPAPTTKPPVPTSINPLTPMPPKPST
ncbi:FecR family protein [Iningainema tapete]|uniref:FecR domain-containing protein n=1 Tax=Iningainema tapete BLCC-T55 TaxID=2748662 RepID=A0A8J6XQB0_9CYAN|nr:FecR family protein [Iningainema tapete]MBD2774517.1 FecR domain-containing protein [Iningainema tapete BLCC-T55]